MLPDAAPGDLLDAFLRAHAQHGVPAVLMATGEALVERLGAAPPDDPRWARALIALGQTASDLGDDDRASRWFLMALRDAAGRGDAEAAVTAGYDQGILQERRGRTALALAAYRTAAREGFRLGDASANLLRCAVRAVDLGFAERGALDAEDARLAKQAWLAWLDRDPELDAVLRSDLQRQLCALLLPEDPAELAAAWRSWPPHPAEASAPPRLARLFAVAADAAERHLADDGGGHAYRLLAAAAARWG